MTTEIVINTVVKVTGVTIDELRSPSRVQNISEARHIAAYALRFRRGKLREYNNRTKPITES